MRKFFVPLKDIRGSIITITGDDVHHIRKVLRMNIGDHLIVSDGNGKDYLCIIVSFLKDTIKCKIKDRLNTNAESPISIVLYQCLPKSDKMDLIIQKCTELGIKEIVPVISSRTIVKLKDEKTEKKLERWNKIARESAKQCNRAYVPMVRPPLDFEEALREISELDLGIIPWERENEKSLKCILRNRSGAKDIGIIVGPEGGFSAEEVNKAKEYGLISVKLGPRILRTETAGFVLVTIIMYEIGDIG